MQTIYEYTMEIVDTVMKAAKLDSIHKHKILSEIHKLKSYRNFKHRVLSDKKVLTPNWSSIRFRVSCRKLLYFLVRRTRLIWSCSVATEGSQMF